MAQLGSWLNKAISAGEKRHQRMKSVTGGNESWQRQRHQWRHGFGVKRRPKTGEVAAAGIMAA